MRQMRYKKQIMYHNRIIFSFLLISILCSILFSSLAIAQDQMPVATTDFKTFMSDYDESNQIFTTYNDGDIILIKDIIEQIKFLEFDKGESETRIWLKSEDDIPGISKYIPIKYIDLNSKFKVGEEVEIELFVYSDQFGHENFSTSESNLKHITIIEEKEEKHGIDLVGFHFEFPESLSFLDNNYGRFLIQFIIWLVIAVVVLLILDPVIRSLTKKTITKIDDIILDIIRKPVLILIILYGIVVSLKELELPSDFMYWINGAYNIGFFLMIIWIGFKIFQGVLLQIAYIFRKQKNFQVEKILIPAVKKLGTVVIAFVALSSILGFLRIDLTLFVAGGVVVSMVIAFAAQDTLSNFFSGMFLILEPKFKEGDIIFSKGIHTK